ncbi:hypothetical protein J421_6153 (plasmid) [Gemmatirosa kalamazoonensis]|uniref:Uncharacterized protein n=2 Tax=Gemmatirosa kalamazoonensis TaxID=861299 RepID=W0RVW1_9BACT|nr:hypothetical protein J421_6153 [Gemmatirosa kalamazoonensis]
MDVMYVWEAFGERPASSGHGARQRFRQVLLALAVVVALLLLLGAAGGFWTRAVGAPGLTAPVTVAAGR